MDDNDSTKRPIIRLVFEQNNIPAINVTEKIEDSNHLLYENEYGATLENYEIFHSPIPTVYHQHKVMVI